ncbi:hypothetical protein ABL78_2215 [Leptomonas seymouri]|uniref:Abscisic acid G-protein coupled receptor-like domain-containing protein n=1 Tax=Leptomonas seymouri TaxID=5684 RepID=A0A0N0P7R5_LEPSE|nr:hypothetical protein ABL78_2215 [Leptomonas seymouri]|eukprot:KPI88677.1 hypothetical protein ABL78_2215 [Leptomonas seymouri]
MGLVFLFVSYAVFYHIGWLLMRLVVVQPLGDGSVVGWCFASTFSVSVSLFSAVLADMARTPAFASWAFPVAPRLGVLTAFQRLVAVDAREFTFLLLCLLSTVLLVCPSVAALHFVSHLLQRGGRGGAYGGGSQAAARSRRASSAASVKGHGSYRRSSVGGDGGHSLSFDAQRNRRRWFGSRRRCIFVVALLLLSGAYWASRTGQLGVTAVGQRVGGVVKAVYWRLRTHTALLRVPHEIEGYRLAGGAGWGDGPAAEDTGIFAAPPLNGQGAAQEGAKLDFTTSSTSLAPLGWSDVVRAITSRVAVVGVAMIGLLAGYAAITTPHLFLVPYTDYRGREEELRKAQHVFTKKLCYVLSSYGNAQRQIAALQYGVLHEEWAFPAFVGSAPSPCTHNAPPSLDISQGSANAEGSLYDVRGASDPLSLTPLWQQQPQGPYQFLESSSAKQYPPPPCRPSLGNAFDATASPTAAAPATAPAATPSAGAVGWLQRKLTRAATAVTSGIANRPLGSPSTPSNSAMTPVMSRQRAVARIKKLREESRGAHFLCLSLYLQLNEVEAMLRDAQRGGAWVGRWYAGLGVAMAFYSAVKIMLTGASLWFFKASTQDPVTRAVTLLEDAFILRRRDTVSGHSFSVVAVEVSAHVVVALALLVNGWMILSSIRGALLALFHVTMSFSDSAISRPETVAVGLSMLIGVYFVGQLVLLRSCLPEPVQWQGGGIDGPTATTHEGANVLLQVLGVLPYYYYQRLNDWCFLVGCLGAVVVRRFVVQSVLSSVVSTASGAEAR